MTADRLAAELGRHGWGDIHYGHQPQDPAITALLAEHSKRRPRPMTEQSEDLYLCEYHGGQGDVDGWTRIPREVTDG